VVGGLGDGSGETHTGGGDAGQPRRESPMSLSRIWAGAGAGISAIAKTAKPEPTGANLMVPERIISSLIF
jgi:hypothetical protein